MAEPAWRDEEECKRVELGQQGRVSGRACMKMILRDGLLLLGLRVEKGHWLHNRYAVMCLVEVLAEVPFVSSDEIFCAASQSSKEDGHVFRG
jgi:hypothetical protein